MGITLKEYREKLYENITLPSGLEVRRKRLNLLALMEALTARGRTVETMGGIDTEDLIYLADELIERMVVEPQLVKVVPEGEELTAIAFSDLLREDYNLLIHAAIEEMNAVATSFRPPTAPDTKPATSRAARKQSK